MWRFGYDEQNRTYSEDRDNDVIIIAANGREAWDIADKYFEAFGHGLTVRRIVPTAHEQVYEI